MSNKLEKLRAQKARIEREIRRARKTEREEAKKRQTKAQIILGGVAARHDPQGIGLIVSPHLSEEDRKLIAREFPKIFPSEPSL